MKEPISGPIPEEADGEGAEEDDARDEEAVVGEVADALVDDGGRAQVNRGEGRLVCGAGQADVVACVGCQGMYCLRRLRCSQSAVSAMPWGGNMYRIWMTEGPVPEQTNLK